MNDEKREAIARLVENHKGVWPEDESFMVAYTPNFMMGLCEVYQQEFERVARELGYINGYRYGVEYPTNGEKPDLPDHVKVEWFSSFRNCWTGMTTVGDLNWSGGSLDHPVEKFRIVDPRYKPESNIEAPLCGKTAAQLERDNWHERGELPPVGSVCAFHKNDKFLYAPEIEERWFDGDGLEVLAHRIGDNDMPVAVVWNVRDKYPSCLIKETLKPLQSERDKVIDKAHEILGKSNREWCEMLYDAGMLKLQEEE